MAQTRGKAAAAADETDALIASLSAKYLGTPAAV
jgi:hypothetical protein